MSELGLTLALGCALISGISLLCKHRGANHAPDVVFRTPLRSASALFRSGWWTIGFGLAAVAWGFHMAALSMAPLSLVQAVIAGGLAMLALPARHWFGISIGPREVIGLCLSAAGLAFLALTAAPGEGAGTRLFPVRGGRRSPPGGPKRPPQGSRRDRPRLAGEHRQPADPGRS